MNMERQKSELITDLKADVLDDRIRKGVSTFECFGYPKFHAEHLVILQRGGCESQPLDYCTYGKHDGTSGHRNVS